MKTETEFEFPSDKNALPMHRYAPYKLKYQIVIEVVEGFEIGKSEPDRCYYLWKVTKKDDKTNHYEGIGMFKPTLYDGEESDGARLGRFIEEELIKELMVKHGLRGK